MHRSLLDFLACPSCRLPFDAAAHAGADERIDLGFLQCPRCAIVIPVLDGFVMFSEPLLHAGLATAPLLANMRCRLFGSADAFAAYRGSKRQRGLVESYAAFAPFNESTRSIEPVLPLAERVLRDGDAILDTWCRTGYSGEWLAGRFPGQRVVSLWEGNSSVLGYAGFRHLLGSGQRAANLDIVFCHLDKPLPFADGVFGMVHAYDSLHRYGLYPFAGECLRVARDDAAVLFPHLHLSNAEPEPFFERGCRQDHGLDYRAWLDRVTRNDRRRGWVFSEAHLFDRAGQDGLVDDPDTSSCNGMVAIMLDDAQPRSAHLVEAGEIRFIVSPLFRLHTGRGTARVDPGLFDGAVGHLLARHPVYEARLPAGSVALSETTLCVLLLAVLGKTETELLDMASPSPDGIEGALAAMAGMELLRPASISAAGHRLQRFHGNQLPADGEGGLQAFWSRIRHCEGILLGLAEGEGLDGNELSQFAHAVTTQLGQAGVESGHWISVAAHGHPLLLAAAIAAASSGINVRLCTSTLPPHRESRLLLHADDVVAPGDLAGWPLGLSGEGEKPSLLSRLMTVEPASFIADPCKSGLVECEVDDRRICCGLADLASGLESLSAQFERQLWLLEGATMFGHLVACLGGWSRVEMVRALSSTEVHARHDDRQAIISS